CCTKDDSPAVHAAPVMRCADVVEDDPCEGSPDAAKNNGKPEGAKWLRSEDHADKPEPGRGEDDRYECRHPYGESSAGYLLCADVSQSVGSEGESGDHQQPEEDLPCRWLVDGHVVGFGPCNVRPEKPCDEGANEKDDAGEDEPFGF